MSGIKNYIRQAQQGGIDDQFVLQHNKLSARGPNAHGNLGNHQVNLGTPDPAAAKFVEELKKDLGQQGVGRNGIEKILRDVGIRDKLDKNLRLTDPNFRLTKGHVQALRIELAHLSRAQVDNAIDDDEKIHEDDITHRMTLTKLGQLASLESNELRRSNNFRMSALPRQISKSDTKRLETIAYPGFVRNLSMQKSADLVVDLSTNERSAESAINAMFQRTVAHRDSLASFKALATLNNNQNAIIDRSKLFNNTSDKDVVNYLNTRDKNHKYQSKSISIKKNALKPGQLNEFGDRFIVHNQKTGEFVTLRKINQNWILLDNANRKGQIVDPIKYINDLAPQQGSVNVNIIHQRH